MDSRWRRTVLEFSLQVLAVWVDALRLVSHLLFLSGLGMIGIDLARQ